MMQYSSIMYKYAGGYKERAAFDISAKGKHNTVCCVLQCIAVSCRVLYFFTYAVRYIHTSD